MKEKAMTRHLSQSCWGRSCLHLAAALRDGHWRWHLAGIRREIHGRLADSFGGNLQKAVLILPVALIVAGALWLPLAVKTKRHAGHNSRRP